MRNFFVFTCYVLMGCESNNIYIFDMQKVVVKICTGTLCYVMGGSELQLLSDYIPSDLAPSVEIKGATCLDYCNQSGSGKAPFVLVNDTVVENATIAKVITAIEQELK